MKYWRELHSFLDSIKSKPSILKTKNWVGLNDDASRINSTNNERNVRLPWKIHTTYILP